MGTRIHDLQVTKVTDGDTIKVIVGEQEESLRLTCVDTEESLPGSSKPVTEAGKVASAMAKKYFTTAKGNLAQVDIEFDTDEPPEVCLIKHRDNYGRLLCYVFKGKENYNVKLVREGWSPYFVKYGRSRLYHKEMAQAEAIAQAKNLAIWDPSTNGSGLSRDYETLMPWWSLRDSVVEDYRKISDDVKPLSVRLDYPKILKAAETNQRAILFCDLQNGIDKWVGAGAVIFAGSKFHKFNLWIPDMESESSILLLRLIEKRYANQGRGYCYVSGWDC